MLMSRIEVDLKRKREKLKKKKEETQLAVTKRQGAKVSNGDLRLICGIVGTGKRERKRTEGHANTENNRQHFIVIIYLELLQPNWDFTRTDFFNVHRTPFCKGNPTLPSSRMFPNNTQ